jgi:S-adenosylmethionine:tRNA ribosyltransferase-isomerase
MPARLFGTKATGGGIEILVERQIDDQCILAQIRASKAPRPQTMLFLEGGLQVRVIGRQDDFYILEFLDPRPVPQLLKHYGHIPLPPYINRCDNETDLERYQTVYARCPGAVAAPTAGLHFDNILLEALAQNGIESAFMTLHVGAATFQPVRVKDINHHRMHEEYMEVDHEVCEAVKHCRKRGGRVVAVGTTTVRGLETAANDDDLRPFRGNTRMFITPGFSFQVVDALITNFHLPESTLLMLVSAFGGHREVMTAYRHAVRERYRFYSYGDAMFVTRHRQSERVRNP